MNRLSTFFILKFGRYMVILVPAFVLLAAYVNNSVPTARETGYILLCSSLLAIFATTLDSLNKYLRDGTRSLKER